MEYKCEVVVKLGDEILAQYGPNNEPLARVVAIGIDEATNDIDQSFYSWVKAEGIIDANTVVIEWVESNPLSYDHSNYAPVGNYMTLGSLCCETFIRRGKVLAEATD